MIATIAAIILYTFLKNAIKAQFGDMDASYLESLCEELYSEIFEENN